jgi:hypothetical protein
MTVKQSLNANNGWWNHLYVNALNVRVLCVVLSPVLVLFSKVPASMSQIIGMVMGAYNHLTALPKQILLKKAPPQPSQPQLNHPQKLPPAQPDKQVGYHPKQKSLPKIGRLFLFA